jgi:phosphoglucomutase/phosphomannomutase
MDGNLMLNEIDDAERQGLLTASAGRNIRKWLTEPCYAEFVPELTRHIAERQWRQLENVFWTTIPFGTGGRRGRMYPIGTNAINDRTIGESAQGLADYLNSVLPPGKRRACAIAYDTRHRSRHFAELCAEIMVAAGFQVYFLDDYRSTPEISYLVRHKQCDGGIMVTASHNPPSDNAVKVYWSTGGQILPPHDKAIIGCVERVELVHRADFAGAVAAGQIELCTAEVDEAFLSTLSRQGFPGPRDGHVVFTPLHGVGASAVCPLLARAGIQQVTLFPPHATPDGNFPNVPGHVSNPENHQVFTDVIEYARTVGADMVLATDPDCDRMGCAAPRTLGAHAEWATFNGNQLAALLADYVLSQRMAAGSLSPRHYLIKTLVTTEMVRRIGESYGVATHGDLPVGFKWIGGAMDQYGPAEFVFGCEESHGYLVGQYARDKDGAVACLLMTELVLRSRAAGQSVWEKLDDLYWQHGLHTEQLLTFQMEGAEGMAHMERLMTRFRTTPPKSLGGQTVVGSRDFLTLRRTVGGHSEPLSGPNTDMIFLDLASRGNCVAVRPSGTEPKVKFYLFAVTPPEQLADLEEAKADHAARLAQLGAEVRQWANSDK